MLQVLANRDIVIEILSHLRPKDIMRLKCTCKSWNNLLSDPDFLRVHHEQSKISVSGHIAQLYNWRLRYFSGHIYYATDMRPNGTFEDRFFRRRIILSTSNGILCSRNHENYGIYKEIYVGNPLCPSRVVISTDVWMSCDRFVLAFFPFGCSSNGNSPSFKVANIHRHGPEGFDDKSFFFSIYSSETGRWKNSNEVCNCDYPLLQPMQQVFASGKFNWLTIKGVIICFDDEQDRSELIRLPVLWDSRTMQCLGESQGHLHYALGGDMGARVWLLLQDDSETKWVLKYHVQLGHICREAFRRRDGTYASHFQRPVDNKYMPRVVCFCNDVLFILAERFSALVSYDLRTGNHRFSVTGIPDYPFRPLPMLIPYSLNLAAVEALKKLTRMSDSPLLLLGYGNIYRKKSRLDVKRKRDDDDDDLL